MSSIRNHYVKYSAHLENINEMASADPCGLVADVEAAYQEVILEIAKQVQDCGCKNDLFDGTVLAAVFLLSAHWRVLLSLA